MTPAEKNRSPDGRSEGVTSREKRGENIDEKEVLRQRGKEVDAEERQRKDARKRKGEKIEEIKGGRRWLKAQVVEEKEVYCLGKGIEKITWPFHDQINARSHINQKLISIRQLKF